MDSVIREGEIDTKARTYGTATGRWKVCPLTRVPTLTKATSQPF